MTIVLAAEHLQYQWRALFPNPVSDSTLRRALQAVDAPVAARVERVRAAVRRVVWAWLALRPGGFPWISVCGRQLAGWYVLDLDATVVTCTSRKEGAAGTFKGTWGTIRWGRGGPTPGSAWRCCCGPGTRPPTMSTTT
ncbi:hypothetical protein [Streptomyces sp. NPDC001774]